jgi:hypothetical protein
MTLNELSAEVARATGNGLGFIIKSATHPERKFRVCFKFASGKYGITRVAPVGDENVGKDYLVLGSEDRYDFVVPIGRIREVKAELGELAEQKALIDARMVELTGVLDGMAAG